MDNQTISTTKVFARLLSFFIEKIRHYKHKSKALESQLSSANHLLFLKTEEAKRLQKKLEYIEPLINTVEGRRRIKQFDKMQNMFIKLPAQS